MSIEKLQQNIKKVQFLIDTLHETKQNQLDEKVINGTLKVNGNLEVDEVRAKNINIKYLNDVIWSPENWLSYTKPQKVTGAFSFKTLNAKQLQTSKESPFIGEIFSPTPLNTNVINIQHQHFAFVANSTNNSTVTKMSVFRDFKYALRVFKLHLSKHFQSISIPSRYVASKRKPKNNRNSFFNFFQRPKNIHK